MSEARPGLRILPWAPERAGHFDRLNRDWLLRFFRVEPIDEDVLTDPGRHVIAPGGDILFAELDGHIVGTGALKAHGAAEYELTKMGVEPGHQNAGIGRALVAALVARWRALGGTFLFLETSSRLPQAIHLYERCGFERQAGLRPGSTYQRSDVYMIYRDPQA